MDGYRLTFKKAALFFAALGCLAAVPCYAVPSAENVEWIQQPDGSTFEAKKVGDERSNWTETTHGFTVERGNDQYWYYVKRYDQKGRALLSHTRAHMAAPGSVRKHVRKPIPRSRRLAKRLRFLPPALAASTYSNVPIVIILVEFTDRARLSSTDSTWAAILVSVKDYFYKNSLGKSTLSPATESSGTANDGVVNWINIGYAHPNTGSNTGTANQKLAADAIKAADSYINYAAFDTNNDGTVSATELAVVVVAAGYEAAFGSDTPGLWGHQWTIPSSLVPVVDGKKVATYAQFGENQSTHTATIGIVAHELGHLIYDLPDLYDTDGSSSGVGYFCLMSGGSWGKTSTQSYSGQSPVNLSAWPRYKLGWLSAMTATGTTSLTASGDDAKATSANTVFLSSSSTATQYFLVENRQPLGYDLGFYNQFGTNSFGGLAIWHIDESKTVNSSDTNRLVNLEPAGRSSLGASSGVPSDLWSSRTGVAFGPDTTPNSRLYDNSDSGLLLKDIGASGNPMTLNVAGAGADVTAPTISITAPASGSTITSATTFTVSASDNVGVSKVEYTLDTTLLGSTATSPFSYDWDPNTAAFGWRTLYATAYDAAGNKTVANVSFINKPATPKLSIITSGAGRGKVVSRPAGIKCGRICSAEVDLASSGDAEQVTLIATPLGRSKFVQWDGCDETWGRNGNRCSVTVDGIISVAAEFKKRGK